MLSVGVWGFTAVPFETIGYFKSFLGFLLSFVISYFQLELYARSYSELYLYTHHLRKYVINTHEYVEKVLVRKAREQLASNKIK